LKKYSWLFEDDSPLYPETVVPVKKEVKVITHSEFETARKMVQSGMGGLEIEAKYTKAKY
jgi:hypothetical protein